MKRGIRIVWCYVEVLYGKLLSLLRIKRDVTVIPHGPYCYSADMANMKDGWFATKPCKYYRYVNKEKSACTYVGYVGWDPCLSDQCKICGENNDYDGEDKG